MRRYPLPFAIAVLSAMLLTARHPAAQQPAGQQPAPQQQSDLTFRAEANFVEVHAIVTGPDGAFVRGLTADDFEIYEDGRLQKPTVFQLVDIPLETPPIPAGSTAPVEPDVRSTDGAFEGRIYVILLDDLHTTLTRTQIVKDSAKQFVQEYLGVNDLAAVVFTSGRQDAGQELTGSRRLLLEAIDRFVARKLPSANTERLAVHLRDGVVPESDDDQSGRTVSGLQNAQQVADPLDLERGMNARRALDAIENISNWLRDVQGRRKALLFFSEGIDYDIYQPFNRSFASSLTMDSREAFAAAQRANVNVYGIDPRGLSQFGGDLVEINGRSDYPQLEYGNFRGALRELLLSQESLIGLAEQTGGLAIVNSNDVAGGLARIVLDNSRYYLLGYYSDSSRWDGDFLELEVRVKRPDVEVRARRGFLPPDDSDDQQAREADAGSTTSPALRAALAKPVAGGDLPFRAFAAPFRGTTTNGSVLVGVEIDGSALRFEEREGRFAESLEITVVAADERARVQGGDEQSFDLNLMPETYERVREHGVRVLTRLDLPDGRYQIRVGAHESTGGTAATVPLDVQLPDYSETPFALSGILLTSTVSGVAVTANAEVQPQGALPTPLVVRRAFGAGELLTAYAEVYDNSREMAHALAYSVTVRNATDGRVVFEAADRRDVGAGETTRTHGFTTPIPLRGVAPGRYVLRVQASAGDESAQREIPFEVR